MKPNFILIKVVGTVSSTKTQILNTNYIRKIYQSDEDPVVRIDLDGDDGSYTIKVKHSLVDMWKKVKGIEL